MTQYEIIVWQYLSTRLDNVHGSWTFTWCINVMRNWTTKWCKMFLIIKETGGGIAIFLSWQFIFDAMTMTHKMANEPHMHKKHELYAKYPNETNNFVLLTAWLLKGRRHTCVCKSFIKLQHHLARILERRDNPNVFFTSLMDGKCEQRALAPSASARVSIGSRDFPSRHRDLFLVAFPRGSLFPVPY